VFDSGQRELFDLFGRGLRERAVQVDETLVFAQLRRQLFGADPQQRSELRGLLVGVRDEMRVGGDFLRRLRDREVDSVAVGDRPRGARIDSVASCCSLAARLSAGPFTTPR